MMESADNNKWHLIHTNNGEWISDDYAVFLSRIEAIALKAEAARQGKELNIQSGPDGSVWCFKHELEAIETTLEKPEHKSRKLKIRRF